MTVWFDVEDLYHYFRSGNKRISGIQRLTFEIYRAAYRLAGDNGGIGFVRHGSGPLSFLLVDWNELAADFEHESPAEPRAALPGEAGPSRPAAVPNGDGTFAPDEVASMPRSPLRRIARRAANTLPADVRRPLVLATVMQVQTVGAVGQFGLRLLTTPARAAARRSRRFAGEMVSRVLPSRAREDVEPVSETKFEDLLRPGDTLLVLGAPWMRESYSDLARWLRDEKRMRFGVLVHDLVPVRHPEWCHRGVPRAFRDWYNDVLPYCDVVFANSQHTARDVEAYARESGIALAGPVQPLPIGTGFGNVDLHTQTPRSPGLPAIGTYVLFVSTVEARKNHALAIRVWSLLVQEVKAGRRAAESVPVLVFAGRVGWLIADLLQQLENTNWLWGKVRMVRDPTDTDLRALYEGCLFTLFPSLHEGWGLPVTESLALGKPCLTSNAAALPEAGGALCRYFDPEDLSSAYQAVTAVLDDRPGLAAWEEQVRREFRPVPWLESAQALLDAVAKLEAAPNTA